MKIKYNRFDYMKIVVYIIAIVLSGMITAHFGYLAYMLNFAENIGYSFNSESVSKDILMDFLSRNLPFSLIISFLLASIMTVGLILSFKETVQTLNRVD